MRDSDGDGSVGWVLNGTLTAFREGAYKCVERGLPLPSSEVVVRFYDIGPAETRTVIVVQAARSGNPIKQSVHYTDRAGQRRFATDSEDRPLIGADTVARRIFAAAAAATCPTPS